MVLPLVWPESDDPALSSAARTVFNLEADVTSLTISADAEHLAATCRDRPLWVWFQGREVNWDETLLPEHRPGGTRSLGLSPDGMTLAAGNVDGTVSLWDTATGKNRVNLRAGDRDDSRGGLLTRWHQTGMLQHGFTNPHLGPGDSSLALNAGRSSGPRRAPSPRWRFLQADGSWHPAERIRPCGSGTWKTRGRVPSCTGTRTWFLP